MCDKETAAKVKASRPGEAIFIDGEGYEFYRAKLTDPASLERAMSAALEKYAPREIAWGSFTGKISEEAKRLVILAFADDKKESTEALKVLEDRILVKFHDRFLFLRAVYRRDSEESKKWSIQLVPSILIIDSAKGEVLERVTGRRTPRELKSILVKALGKSEKK